MGGAQLESSNFIDRMIRQSTMHDMRLLDIVPIFALPRSESMG